MNYFFVTSALNTPHGVFTQQQREHQLIETFNSIKKSIPDAKIILVEASPEKISHEQEQMILSHCDNLLSYSQDTYLQYCYARWQIAAIQKNLGETYCMKAALAAFDFNTDDIIFKLSGRYVLRDDFRINYIKGKITLSHFFDTGNPETMSHIRKWRVSRLFYWGGENHSYMRNTYSNIHETILEHVKYGRYTDIEHGLYHCIDENLVNSLEHNQLGIEGYLAATGDKVQD